jgi:hypothetical protein
MKLHESRLEVSIEQAQNNNFHVGFVSFDAMPRGGVFDFIEVIVHRRDSRDEET